jgi:hypothetical protein
MDDSRRGGSRTTAPSDFIDARLLWKIGAGDAEYWVECEDRRQPITGHLSSASLIESDYPPWKTPKDRFERPARGSASPFYVRRSNVDG